MSEEQTSVVRRLAAILAADVVGYSKLMGRNEESTLVRVKAVQRQIVEPRVDEFGGRLVKTTGDGFLVEFGSVVSAVHCATEIQKDLVQFNDPNAADDAIVMRIGVNIGDIIVSDDDIFGDGVNVAARLESIAEPGGICVSEDVYRQFRGKSDFGFVDRGAVELKNISEPVKVWSVGPRTADGEPARTKDTLTADLERIESRPAIAVLPFENMSNDPEQEYFVDGITEDVITGLSCWRSFPVIARNSVFTYKGKAVDVKQVGQELGARYVLEGSVRKAGERVRISAQLIDAKTGHHIWAERYDRQLEDIFDLQDEITERITTTITPELQRAEHSRIAQKEPTNLNAWDLTLRATYELEKVEAESHIRAKELLNSAIAADPTASGAPTMAARCHMEEVIWGWSEDPVLSCETAVRFARDAVRNDDSDFLAHNILGMCLLISRQHDQAVSAIERANELNPAFALNYLGFAMIAVMSGRTDEVEPNVAIALRLSPRDPLKTFMLSHVSLARLLDRDFDASVEWADRAIAEFPGNPMAHQYRASALGHLGDTERAREALAAATELRPTLSPDYVRNAYPFKNSEDADFLIEGLSKAGLPA